MEAQFRELCEQHGLTCVGTLFQPPYNHITVYLHWDDGGDDRCVSGGGKTFDFALAEALAVLSVRRGAGQLAEVA